MAQKRMFDKAIIDTDRFIDLSVSAKALYFLLGMEADDEGFVSYKKVMRVHGGNEDDIKILIAKGFVIIFDSGVIVITDWHSNNWLDSRRIKRTQYQDERKLIVLTKNDKYVLSKGLASIEENRIEENIDIEVEPDKEAVSLIKEQIRKSIKRI
jgi:F0F1-type ATP synthase epsilon subunit